MTIDRVAPTLPLAVRDEFRRILHGRIEEPTTVAVNGVLVTMAWFLLPTKLNNVLFNLHSSMAFALVLAVWMYSDVPATNVLGPDKFTFLCIAYGYSDVYSLIFIDYFYINDRGVGCKKSSR